MASRKASAAGPGPALGAAGRDRAHLELAELGPLLEEKGEPGAAGARVAAPGAGVAPERLLWCGAEDPPCPAAREEEEEVVRVLTLPLQAHHAMEKMEEFVYKVQEAAASSRLDYSGIALLIMGSFVPWLYYSFYCSPQPRLIYLSIVCVLGISAIIVAQWDRFATPKHRQTRAGVFLGLGLSGVVPTMHFTIAEGFVKATTVGQMGWFFLMAVMYITGAGLYAARIPERFFPGKFDIWFQSHQIFHVLVVAAAFVHFYGVSNLQEFRYGLEGGCTDDSLL
ncbi:adiponectin receptor protein 1 [Amazona aestiva]|uniref:Adiponectin receptor protein 1 n=3 Tax=Neoaves TaxID=3078114 RepID=A0A0Q3LXF9_AMAAE|nr:adiponectin receptor protein 1 [Amazona aestiva]